MKIGIIGGGITGLVAGYHLSKEGHNVTVFESSKELGGLASSFRMDDFFLEKYYHHIFTSDMEIMGLISELGLQDKVVRKSAKMGIFYKGKTHPFTTPMDLLRFKPFDPLDKLRFGFSILKLKRLKNWRVLDDISAKDWMLKHAGRDAFNIIWKPLLESKFGGRIDDISAAWLWGRIKARAGSRSRGMMKENLGYLRGGFHALIDALAKGITGNGGMILKGRPVVKIAIKDRAVSGLVCNKRNYAFDAVISTIPNPILLKIVPGLPKSYANALSRVDYQGVVCMVLKLENPLTDIYWLNISDSRIPFGLMVGHTTLTQPDSYGGSIVYLSNYVPYGSRFYTMPDRVLLNLYKKGLKVISPNFDEKMIIDWRVFRDRYATPIYTKNYSAMMPDYATPIKGLCIANTSQIYPEDRNMSNSIVAGKRVCEIIEL